MLLLALRRFLTLLAILAAACAVLGLALAGLTHESVLRGLAVGLYIGGAGLWVLAFLLGSRPPVRGKGSGGFVGLGRWLGEGVRFATREEQDEKLNLPTLFVSIGLCLVLIGAAIDTRHSLA